MRCSTLTAALSLGSLLSFAGCDPEDVDLDGAVLDADEPVTFRCLGTPCLQSPHVGSFDISNLAEDLSVVSAPNGSLTVQRTGLTKNWLNYAEMRVTDLAKCEVRQANTAMWESCVGATINLQITRNGTVTTAKIKIESETVDNSGALTVYKYDVKTDLDPETGTRATYAAYSVCPAGGDDGTRKVVMLPDVRLSWTHVNNDDGLAELGAALSTRFTLACDGYALAKGYVRGKVLPNTGGARNYGISNYNGFTHAMRALFRNQGTTNEYSALTEHGTLVSIKDLANNPPLFDELTASPPALGYGVYLLESAYNGSGSVQGGRKGATCKKSHVDYACSSAPDYPNGIHRRPEFSPPITDIPGWSDLPDCDMGNLGSFGSVGIYEWYEGYCFVQW